MCVATNAGSEAVAIGLPKCIDPGVASDLAANPGFGLPGGPVDTDHSRLNPGSGMVGVIEPSDRRGEME